MTSSRTESDGAVDGASPASQPSWTVQDERDARQRQIAAWAREAFGAAQAQSLAQRGLRLLEEAIEAFQAVGGYRAQAHTLVDYVFGRPVGDLAQELGGVGVCALVLAQAAGLSADLAERCEVERVIGQPIEAFRRRNQAKIDAGLVAPDLQPAPLSASHHLPEVAHDRSRTPIHVWTDGACSGNPGPAGAGVVICDGESTREISLYLGESTNNVAELAAILLGLEAIPDRQRKVIVYSDSQYAIGLLSQGWKAKKNVELVTTLRRLCGQMRDVSFVKVAAHSGDPLNDWADRLAVQAVERRWPVRSSQETSL